MQLYGELYEDDKNLIVPEGVLPYVGYLGTCCGIG